MRKINEYIELMLELQISHYFKEKSQISGGMFVFRIYISSFLQFLKLDQKLLMRFLSCDLTIYIIHKSMS